MRKEALVAVFPEGVKGIGKLFKERYQLQRFGRGGFIKLCLRTGTPIVPVAVIGAEEANPMIGRIEYLSKAIGVPYIPVTPTFPLLGPLGLLPAPDEVEDRLRREDRARQRRRGRGRRDPRRAPRRAGARDDPGDARSRRRASADRFSSDERGRAGPRGPRRRRPRPRQAARADEPRRRGAAAPRARTRARSATQGRSTRWRRACSSSASVRRRSSRRG